MEILLWKCGNKCSKVDRTNATETPRFKYRHYFIGTVMSKMGHPRTLFHLFFVISCKCTFLRVAHDQATFCSGGNYFTPILREKEGLH